MSTKDFTANVISATKVVPDGNFKDSKASGIWDINEALDLIKGGNWPNVANINPAAFVDGLFQTHVYVGNGSSGQSITNNLDLSGKGGLVWTKGRDSTNDHHLFDTERGVTKYLKSSSSGVEATDTDTLTAFNSNGFSLGADVDTNADGNKYVSWSFRKQPKFFDVVTYTGTGSARTISHSLGSVPGSIWVKCTSDSYNWAIYHRGVDSSAPEDYLLYLDATDARVNNSSYWNDTAPTSSVFTVGTSGETNANGETYVAYIFAHHDDDGGFGEPGNQDIIKCDTYTGNGNATGPVIDLGFEPQWIMIKRSSAVEDWIIFDNMRGLVVGGIDPELRPNKTQTEGTSVTYMDINATGFQLTDNNSRTNENNSTYIYMAIRRGGMQTPTAASSVFAISEAGTNDSPTNNFTIGFDADMNISTTTAGNQKFIVSRLLGNSFLKTNADSAETSQSDASFFGGPTGTIDLNTDFFATSSSVVSWSWARARGYFDVVTTKSTNGNVNHNLGVAPEMVWYKRRDSAQEWYVCTAANGVLKLNTNAASAGSGNGSYLTNAYGAQVTSTTVNTGYNFTAATTADMIIYLFATVAGVSKVGLFTQSGATNVACGFTGDTPALIIYKRTDGAGNWHIYDSVRGIVAGNDAHLFLDTTDNEQSSDYIDPYSGGFATTSGVTNGDYIFYAIAATS